ncbi:hypothetical protein OH76DRAFT_279597 [Lentinus brumalis]|uniref:Uncharacterized protein n=1 Tax=Lentinus brumalis TaxID=2498619 RepID=A0A371CKY4_9APHY|nr:hypothetical protein OH76DRAFT_279597 [Polyporus brumalis]
MPSRAAISTGASRVCALGLGSSLRPPPSCSTRCMWRSAAYLHESSSSLPLTGVQIGFAEGQICALLTRRYYIPVGQEADTRCRDVNSVRDPVFLDWRHCAGPSRSRSPEYDGSPLVRRSRDSCTHPSVGFSRSPERKSETSDIMRRARVPGTVDGPGNKEVLVHMYHYEVATLFEAERTCMTLSSTRWYVCYSIIKLATVKACLKPNAHIYMTRSSTPGARQPRLDAFIRYEYCKDQ